MLKSITSCSSLAILRRSHISSIYKSGVRLASLHSTPAIQREGLGDFSLTDRVAIVTGGNRGLGLEAALALSTAGSRVVYCLDLPEKPEKAAPNGRRNCNNGGEDGYLRRISRDRWSRAALLGVYRRRARRGLCCKPQRSVL
ncbi:hypothetical protein EV424DRAFT_1088356 [Suillus variegatus]|nr:hypothetical protein EV424DRAFT_1088356 [Suillus variegatus]